MKRNQSILLALACCMLPSTLSFTVVASTAKISSATTRGFALYGKQKIENTDDFPQWDDDVAESAGSVDWDAEWKKVVENGGNAGQKVVSDRPGQGYYKSEAEIAAIRAANKATTTVTEVASQVPTWDQAKGDWKLWIGVLAAISIGVALLSAQPDIPAATNISPESYYI